MPVELTIVESVTELETTVVEVILESASTPGPAGVGVPTGGTYPQVLTKQSATDFDADWQDPTGGGGGVTDADYLVGTAHAGLSAEIVVGTSPGGELGGTWASPTVDATHSGSSHASVQAAAEATAAAALSAHLTDTSDAHDASAISLSPSVQGSSDVQGGLATLETSFAGHLNDTSDAHDGTAISFPPSGPILSTDVTNAIVEVANLAILDSLVDAKGDLIVATAADTPARLAVGTDDHVLTAASGETSGLKFSAVQTASIADGAVTAAKVAADVATQAELDAHINDASDAHDASAISVLDTNGDYTATDVEGVLAEIAPQLGGSSTSPDDENLILHMEVFA